MENFKYKNQMIQGVRVGLIAFIISYGISFICSIIINFAMLERLNVLLKGALSDKVSIGFSSIVKVTSIIMNFSVFNSIENIRCGILLLAIIPFIAFFIADKKCNNKEGLDINNIVVYITSSVIFSILLSILSLATRGVILDIDINFFSLRNIFLTILVALLIQVVIGMNYNKNNITGIKAARIMTRIILGIGSVLGLILLITILSGQITGFFAKVLLILVLLPNVAIYVMFLLMGINLQISEPLLKLIDYASDDVMLTFGSLPLAVRIISIVSFFIIIGVSLFFLNKEKYLKELGIFAITFSGFTTLVAFCTTIDLGVVKVVDVALGINMLQAFFIPFIMVGAIGFLVFLVRKAINIVKEV